MNKLLDLSLINSESLEKGQAIKHLKFAEDYVNDSKISNEVWYKFLNESRKPDFLKALETDQNRNRWAELVFKLIQKTDYTLLKLIEQRVEEHPEKILFLDKSKSSNTEWTYKQVFHHIKEIAAFIYSIQKDKPRVALFLNNETEGAITDLACLSYDIFVSPINIHFNSEILEYIFKELNINIVVTDTSENLKIVSEAIKKSKLKIKIIVSQVITSKLKEADYYLSKECKKFTLPLAEKILSERAIKKINQVATTMFTSGSTGMPKGVSFSVYNIVSKRFARAAALPQVGENEKFICYLPLFHTFGRFLELTGSIFWSGTYVFTGNASSETLLSLFPKENPTGFISVPVRWVQLYEKCIEATENIYDENEKRKIIKSITGEKLHWGLSAAGYLDPKIFRYFHRNGIKLNSGFGMTEATGGITMTPSDDYRENSTGLPLPGMYTRIKNSGELEIKSHYLAKYLEDAGPDDIIPFPHEEDYWLSTGDIFTINKSGFHEIIDRVKDIYKNNKGQTIAPGTIEKKFTGVPGIKQTFLVGDGQPYNVLLIVPDFQEPVIRNAKTNKTINEYFHQIIMTANKDLAPYERVINFSILNRDFSKEKDELTAKESFKRKNITKNYEELIKNLYKTNYIVFKKKGFIITIPRWFYRDLGILETDIISTKTGLFNKVSKQNIRIIKINKDNAYLIGDLEYIIYDRSIDLGRLVRQPKLWVGNPELIAFSPCKESFDIPLKNISPQLAVPSIGINLYNPQDFKQPKGINDPDLLFLNALVSEILHCETSYVLKSLNQIENLFPFYEINKAEIIRRRLEALACHRDEKIRVTAYRILLTKDPEPDFLKLFPAFINSGKTFLNEESILSIAKSTFSINHLDALRKRMHKYRTELNWPANKQTRKQFETIFELLLNFGLNNPQYYKSIRSEFATWMLLKQDPVLSKKAEKCFQELYAGFSKYIKKNSKHLTEKQWKNKLVFDDGISEENKHELISKLSSGFTLRQAVVLIYDDFNFDIDNVNDKAIWVSRLKSYRNTKHYRMSINDVNGKHYDLHILIDKTLKTAFGLETLYRMISIAGYPYDRPSISSFGCSDPDEKILVSGYLSMLTAWDKVRALAEAQAKGYTGQANAWRKIFIRSVSAYMKAWCYSNREIMPGFISLNNIAIPENDFSDNAVIISLSGWKKIDSYIPLFTAILQNFYNKTLAHYPISKNYLKIRWIFHGCFEALGKDKTMAVLNQLETELRAKKDKDQIEKKLLNSLEKYFIDFKGTIYLPLPLFNAVDRYTDWLIKNPSAGKIAKEQTILELFELYALAKYPDIVRYKFYRETFFKDFNINVIESFDTLLNKMSININTIPIQFTELSDLQGTLLNKSDKDVFNKMVFPDIKTKQKVDILTIGEKKDEHVIVKSVITDKKDIEYTMREPLEASEVGTLYKLFYKENYPKEISKMDKHYIVIDINEQVIGGLCYKELGENLVLIDGMAVTSPLHGKGIGSAMMEDFFTRMKVLGVKTIKAHFLFGNYYLKHNFVIDKKWGALVKEL